MLTVTDLAVIKLKEYMAANKINSTLRISLMNGGCSGMSLGLSLDEKKDGDISFDKESILFVMESSLVEQCGAINLDYMDSTASAGFALTSEKPIGGGCSSCSSGSCG